MSLFSYTHFLSLSSLSFTYLFILSLLASIFPSSFPVTGKVKASGEIYKNKAQIIEEENGVLPSTEQIPQDTPPTETTPTKPATPKPTPTELTPPPVTTPISTES